MLQAIEYLGKVGVGITGPEFFRANDNNLYIVKRSNNYVGPNVLISELIASLLGEKLDLPFATGKLINLNSFISKQKTFSPIGFASLYIANTQYATPEIIGNAENLSTAAGMILFDYLFFNADRTTNRKNILITKQSPGVRLYGIDHSHLFKTGRWTPEALDKISDQIKLYTSSLYGVLLRKYLTPADFSPYVAKISTITEQDITMILATIPTDWYTDKNILPSLASFIKKRFTMAGSINEAILKFMSEQQ